MPLAYTGIHLQGLSCTDGEPDSLPHRAAHGTGQAVHADVAAPWCCIPAAAGWAKRAACPVHAGAAPDAESPCLGTHTHVLDVWVSALFPARFAVLAGDPCQLPPVLAAPAEVAPQGADPGAGPPAHGLLRPLFSRLAAAGGCHLLRRQYRCGPLGPLTGTAASSERRVSVPGMLLAVHACTCQLAS